MKDLKDKLPKRLTRKKEQVIDGALKIMPDVFESIMKKEVKQEKKRIRNNQKRK